MSSSVGETGASTRPLRLFLDTGVIIEGCLGSWGAAKAVLILATIRTNWIVVLAEAIERELQAVIARKTAALSPDDAQAVAESVAGWMNRVRMERWPLPSATDLDAAAPTVLPLLRHVHDLPAVVTAMQARPDWTLSTNTAHWNEALGARIGLRIATPLAFLQRLTPIAG